MSPVATGSIGAVLTVALVSVAARTQPAARPNEAGWKVLRSGWLLNGTIALGAGLAMLIGWILLFVGSSRPDAATQMIYAAILAGIPGVGAVYMAWASYGRTIMWRDEELRIRTRFAGTTVHHVSGAVSVTRSDFLGEYRVRFRDGSTFRFSAYLHGSDELAEALPARANGDRAGG